MAEVPLDCTYVSKEDVVGSGRLGICSCPGAKRGGLHGTREMEADIVSLTQAGVTDLYTLTPKSEMRRLKVEGLHEAVQAAGIAWHYFPCEDGLYPAEDQMPELVKSIIGSVETGRSCMVHCRGGMGRAVTAVAVVLAEMAPSRPMEEIINRLRALRGNGAVQTVKQYNFLNEYVPRGGQRGGGEGP